MTQQKRPKHHHYISEFYLRRFAHEKQIAMYRRATGHRRIIGIRAAAVETDFYTVISEDRTPSAEVERALGVFETHAGAILSQIDDGTFPPPEDERQWLAGYIALMLTRTPEYQHTLDAHTSIEPIFIETALPEDIRTELRNGDERELEGGEIKVAQALRAYLATAGTKPSKTAVFAQALSFALYVLAPRIISMGWQLVTTNDLAFVTSDHPVVYWHDPSSALDVPSVGLTTADEVYFPLGPRQLLVLTQAGAGRAPFQATGEAIARVNSTLIAAAYEMIFSYPDHDALVGIEISKERPLLHVNGAPIFCGGRGSDEARRRVEGSILQSGPRRSTFAMISAGHNYKELGPGWHGNPAVKGEYDNRTVLFDSWPGKQSGDRMPFRVIDGKSAVLFHFMRGDRYWAVTYNRDSDTWKDHGEQSASAMQLP